VVTSVIIGANKPEQLDDNLKATSVSFNTAELQKLEEVSRLAPEYPSWMLERQAVDRRK
jgi:aryl-alcohol dehydrogenase-like predicted oxidoreductase